MNKKLETMGSICKDYRLNSLDMTLQELSYQTGINLKTLSGFEHGRSSNVKILFAYVDMIKNEQIEILFMLKIVNALKGGA